MPDSLFKGCVIPARFPFIEAAAKYIIKELALDIEDMGERPCCMEPVGLRSLNGEAWLNVSSYICSLSGGSRIVTLCDGCTLSLSESVKEKGDGPEVVGLFEILYENIGRIRKSVKAPIAMRTAVFPGCHLDSMMRSKGRDAGRMMSEIIEAIGGTPLIPGENLCCGGGVSSIDDELSKKILNETVDSFRASGADAAVTACPFCFMQFDMVARYKTYNIFELIAKAMGWEADTEKYHRGKSN